MAHLARRPSGTVQIRESVRTNLGPRSRTLASFRGPLSDRILDEAARRATRPFDREAVIARAHAMGIGWESTAASAARQLVARLRNEATLDPALVGLLREQLAPLDATPVDETLRDAVEWVGTTDVERGATLRGLLRLADAIVRSRTVEPARRALDYPLIDSVHAGSDASRPGSVA